MNYEYDIQQIKEELTIEQIFDILNELGGEPQQPKNDIIISRTICHNGPGKGSWKLYYYDNSHLFRCYTACGDSFDIFELVKKVKSLVQGTEYGLPQAIQYVANYFGYSSVQLDNEYKLLTEKDFTYLKNYDRIKDIKIENQIVELKTYDDNFLKNFPRPLIMPWINDGISKEIMNEYEICFDPKNCGIIIPHRDYKGNLIGIRERSLVQEIVEQYGKYRPMKLGNKMYNHPLSFNLYGLNKNKNNIQQMKKVIVLESEKAVLQYATMFGQENNITCAICGSSFINYQAWLLINLGVDEIIIGLDHDFTDVNSAEAKHKIKNLKQIHKKYGNYVNISFMWDKDNITGYKDSPTDCGKDIFLKLFQERISIYD